MAEIPDPVEALLEVLKADETILSLVGARVFGGELPAEEVDRMPRRCIVLAPAGSLGAFGRGFQRYGDQRFDVFCYGSAPREAHRVWIAVYQAFKHLRPTVKASCRIYWANAAGGPIPLRDPETEWPFTAGSFQVLVGELAAV